MDISKYLKNKDIEITNDDINVDKLQKDLLKGYISEEEAKAKETSAEEELNKKISELTSKVSTMQTDYDTLQGKYTEQANSLRQKNLENVMLSQGFKADNFDEVSKLRTGLYGDIKDDTEAVQKVKEHFGKVYFESESKSNPTPEESNLNSNKPKEEQKDIVITRKTSVKDLFVKKN